MIRRPRLGSLCTGYGGLDLAVLAVLGDASKVLAARWPDLPNLGDLRAVDWSSVEPVDIVTAGYPCQPISAAGKRRGSADERWIWPDVFAAVRVLRPRLVVLENVAGHLSLGFGQVLGDLASAGFDAEWGCVRASDVGAPHRRERVFIVAWPANAAGVGHRDTGPARVGRVAPAAVAGVATHADGDAVRQQPVSVAGGRGAAIPRGSGAGTGVVSLLPTPAARDWKSGESNIMDRNARPLNEVVVNLLPTPKGSDGRHGGPGQRSGNGRTDLALPSTVVQHAERWGDYGPAVARWEHVTGRPAPDPTEPGAKGQPRLSPRFVEWLIGLPAGWVTGHLPRNAALRVLGNGVVPQQAAAAIEWLVSS